MNWLLDRLQMPPQMCDRCHRPAPFGKPHRCPKGRRK